MFVVWWLRLCLGCSVVMRRDAVELSYVAANLSISTLETRTYRECLRHIFGHRKSPDSVDSFGLLSRGDVNLVQVRLIVT